MARHPFTIQDLHLWDDIRQSVRPLRSVPGKRQQPAKTVQPIMPTRSQAMTLPLLHHADPPALSGFDRRTAQKLARGQLEPDARIDLHGTTLATAHVQLHQFIRNCQNRGDRLVLVITGKGASPFAGHTLHGYQHYDSPERDGKLRREVPHWLHEPAFRALVIGFQPAHPRHGGGGAFYLRLRRSGSHVP
jgi:DNA-nicking Smr family endonuclease